MWRCGCSEKLFQSFNRLGVCQSRTAIRKAVDTLCAETDVLQEWKSLVESESTPRTGQSDTIMKEANFDLVGVDDKFWEEVREQRVWPIRAGIPSRWRNHRRKRHYDYRCKHTQRFQSTHMVIIPTTQSIGRDELSGTWDVLSTKCLRKRCARVRCEKTQKKIQLSRWHCHFCGGTSKWTGLFVDSRKKPQDLPPFLKESQTFRNPEIKIFSFVSKICFYTP